MELKMQIPQFFKEIIIKQYGVDITNKIIEGYTRKRPVTLRVNTIKATTKEIKSKLDESGIEVEEVEWNKDALIIKNIREEEIQKLEMYKNGEIYLQSLSSMIPPILLEPEIEENILDMTAAPGGKTTQIAALTNNGAFITAVEKNKIRAERLKYNLQKQGINCVNIMIEDARRLSDFFSFDKILLDAPCSGEGMFRKDKNAINEWNENLKFYNKKRQLDILWCANSLLKNGGYLIYSTCTYNTIENESVINDFCNEFGYKIFSPCQDVMDNTFGGITLNGNADLSKTRHFFPFLSKGEGQYVACLQKLGEDLQEKQPLLNSNLTQMEQKLVEDFFNKNLTNFDLKNFVFYKIGNYINVMPAKTVDFGNIKYLCYGVAIAEIVKDRLIPTQQFFSSYGKNFKSQLNLSTDGSLYKNYLLGEQISFNQVENDKNATLCYDNNSNYASILVDGMSVGGVKIVDGVLKNHYPKALRTNKVE